MLVSFLKEHGEYYSDKYFKDLTTLKMGGKIKHYLIVNSLKDLQVVIAYLKTYSIMFKVIGNGSNLVCGDAEYDGVIISLNKLNDYEISNDELYVEAGVKAPAMANILAKEGLSCLEFASGIPGNIGGLIYMNAGAYKVSMSDVVKEVLVLKNDQFVWLKNEELDFAYRHSLFQSHPRWVIVAAKLELVKKNAELILELQADRLKRRKETQPLDLPSAGCCFRNPTNNFAWKLVDGIGYRGYRINGVAVSDKHSNFIVNDQGGNANDYLTIAYEIIDKVKEKYGIKLVMEVEKFNC